MTQTTDQAAKAREQFEAWAHAESFEVRRSPVDPNRYSDGHVGLMWEAWQAALSQQPAGDGMLPDALVHVSDQWYRLCERAASVGRISISGRLAEAIVKSVVDMAVLSQQPAPEDVLRDAARYRWLRAHYRFGGDSMSELWFDGSLAASEDHTPVMLDRSIDTAMLATRPEVKEDGHA